MDTNTESDPRGMSSALLGSRGVVIFHKVEMALFIGRVGPVVINPLRIARHGDSIGQHTYPQQRCNR
jgi:hypothetical protein